MLNGSLVIHDVTTEDSGKYTCFAGNSCNIKHQEASLRVVGMWHRFGGCIQNVFEEELCISLIYIV